MMFILSNSYIYLFKRNVLINNRKHSCLLCHHLNKLINALISCPLTRSCVSSINDVVSLGLVP